MPAPESARKRLLRTEGLPIIAVLLALVMVFMIAAPDVFLGYRIYMSFLATVPPLLVLAAALTLLIAAGEIDLSFPSVIALSGWVLGYFTHVLGSPWLGLLLALLAGAVVGWLNGILVARIGVPSIIATLATQFLWGGLTTVFSQGLSYSLGDVDKGSPIRSETSTSTSSGTSWSAASGRSRCRRSGRWPWPRCSGWCSTGTVSASTSCSSGTTPGSPRWWA